MAERNASSDHPPTVGSLAGPIPDIASLPRVKPEPRGLRLRHASPQRAMLLAIRLLYMVMLVTVTLLPFVGKLPNQTFGFTDYAGAFIATFIFGTAVLVIDALTPNKRLASVFGIYLGIVAGLAAAVAVGALLDLIAESWSLTQNPWLAYLGLIKLAIGITLCYLAVSIVLTTKDDIRLVIPYVEFSKQVRGVRPLLLDTSALIDGRINNLGQTGFLEAPLVVPQFVVNELQTLADSGDKLKRARGRRGLDLVSTLQTNPVVDVSIDPREVPGHSVDHMLIHLAADQNLRILTTDYNLNKVAKIHGVEALNLNDLASTLRPQTLAGDTLLVEIIKRGESARQGVGYMPDGTMVVVEEASDRIGDSLSVVVTNALQTSAGRMIFARPADEKMPGDAPSPPSRTSEMAQSATTQGRTTTQPSQRPESSTGRNPRR